MGEPDESKKTLCTHCGVKLQKDTLCDRSPCVMICALEQSTRIVPLGKRASFWGEFKEFYNFHVKDDVRSFLSAQRYGQTYPTVTERAVTGFVSIFGKLNKLYPIDGSGAVLPSEVKVSPEPEGHSCELGHCAESTIEKDIGNDLAWLRGHWGVQADDYIDDRHNLFKKIFPFIARTSPLIIANEIRCRIMWSQLINKQELNSHFNRLEDERSRIRARKEDSMKFYIEFPQFAPKELLA